MHPQKVTVWCALWSKGIIGPYFFEDEAGNTVTVDSQRYYAMIEDYFCRNLKEWICTMFFFNKTVQLANIQQLQSFFGNRLISRNGNVNWPARSCDLTPLDYFLWGFLKSKVYVNKPATIQDLKHNIIAEINAIETSLLENVIENFDHRVDVCKASRGEHLSDIIFHP